MATKKRKHPAHRTTRLSPSTTRAAAPAAGKGTGAEQLRGIAAKGAAFTTRSEPPPTMEELGMGSFPGEDDVKGRAQYLVDLIGALANHKAVEVKRIRAALITIIAEFDKLREHDRAQAERDLKVRLASLEIGLMDMLIQTTSKMRDKIGEQARILGTKTPAGKVAHGFAEGMNKVVVAMQTMREAAMTGDTKLRDQANALMKEGSDILNGMKSLGG